MNPAGQQQNPYAAIAQQFASRRGGGAGAMGGTPPPTAQPQGSALAQAQAGAKGAGNIQTPAQPGQATKILLSALQALNQFVSTPGADPAEITIIRSLIAILSQLVQRDQQRAHQLTAGGQPQPQGAQMPPMGGGAGNPMAMMGR